MGRLAYTTASQRFRQHVKIMILKPSSYYFETTLILLFGGTAATPHYTVL